MVNTILKEADLFCPNSVRINFTIYRISKFRHYCKLQYPTSCCAT
ncbi:ABC transporter ATP-binding protein [Latilactobacillus curvatus]|nr:ABC transporter ATP-binding protein [Latilactobacillus curvatus]MCT3527255.1 ABC transporter ATP-binding protein [Latilactobacillus curvatus]